MVKDHKKLLESLEAKGRIYISEDGINGQMSIEENHAETYLAALRKDFPDLDVKIDPHPEHAFAKLTVKYRKQLAALDKPIDITKTGTHLSPQQWKDMLENPPEDMTLLDVRNDYEWEVGHFEGADLPPLKNFRDFPDYVKTLKKGPVMMYCTGGIRCEIFSAYMKEEGVDEIYQLDGGVIKYGKEVGNDHWKGKLFVFDDRMVVPIAPGNSNISTCKHCGELSSTYYNCANMDCNDLFLSCQKCNSSMKGCCSNKCIEAPRVRAYQTEENPKPFRKLSKESSHSRA